MALAHAEVTEVVPASNSVLAESPAEITVTFSEAVSLNGGSVEVFDDTGETVPSDGPDRRHHHRHRASRTAGRRHLRRGLARRVRRLPSGVRHERVQCRGTIDRRAGRCGCRAGDPWGGQRWRVAAMAATYAGVLASVGLWWYARRWHRLAADLDAELADDEDVPAPGPDRLDLPVDTVDGSVDDGIVTALRRVGRWQIGAALLGIVGLLVAFPARLVTVGGGWDALSDGGFVSDTFTGPIGLATFATIAGASG